MIRERLRNLAAERRRFGYQRLGILLKREGITMNKKKLFRLYKEEGLAVRRRRGRKRATGTRAPMALPEAMAESPQQVTGAQLGPSAFKSRPSDYGHLHQHLQAPDASYISCLNSGRRPAP